MVAFAGWRTSVCALKSLQRTSPVLPKLRTTNTISLPAGNNYHYSAKSYYSHRLTPAVLPCSAIMSNPRRRSLSWKLPAMPAMKKPGFVKNLQTSPKSETAAAILTRGDDDTASATPSSRMNGISNGTASAATPTMNGISIPAQERHLSTLPSTSRAVADAAKGIFSSSTDFRSDTVTVPTPSMLEAIMNITLHGDDVYREDQTTIALEARMAELTGKQAGLFVLSGTMANQLAIRTLLTQPPHSVLTDARAHLCNYEAGGVAVLSQAQITPVKPANGAYITLEEVREAAILSDDHHYAPTKVISLENSLNGAIMPLKEVKRISHWARSQGIKMHLDGARLWNVVAAGAGSLAEFCDEFDMISLCFSKGLGAPMGSILVGETEMVERARWYRKMVGGGTRQSGVATAPARVAVEEIFLGGGLDRSHAMAKRIEKTWTELGGKVEFPCQTNMVWTDLAPLGITGEELAKAAADEGLKLSGGRIVVHHQISDEAIEKLEEVLKAVVKGAKGRSPLSSGGGTKPGNHRYGSSDK